MKRVQSSVSTACTVMAVIFFLAALYLLAVGVSAFGSSGYLEEIEKVVGAIMIMGSLLSVFFGTTLLALGEIALHTKAAHLELTAAALGADPQAATPARPAAAGSWVCPSCGKSNSADSAFCIGCGTKKNFPAAPKPAAAPNTWLCPTCNTRNNTGSAYCIGCGAKR